MAKIIGLVGLTGTGKSEASRLVVSLHPMPVVYFGGVVLDEVKARGLEVTPENERTVREELRAHDGMAVMAKRRLPQIKDAIKTDGTVLVDGIYSWSELILLRETFGDDLTVIAIHASKPVRADRLAARSERPLTMAQMTTRDEREIRMLEKAPPIALADHHIVNNGTPKELRSALEAILKKVGL